MEYFPYETPEPLKNKKGDTEITEESFTNQGNPSEYRETCLLEVNIKPPKNKIVSAGVTEIPRYEIKLEPSQDYKDG